MGYFNNLFGAIAGKPIAIGTDKQFIPINGKDGVMRLDGMDADWLGLGTKMMQYWAYKFCPPVASVIDRLAECDVNGKVEFINSKGNFATGNKVKALKKLFNRKPNKKQTWTEFRGEQKVYNSIYGHCAVWKFTASGFENDGVPTYLINLDPLITEPYLDYDAGITGSQIKFWRTYWNGKSYDIPNEEIILLKDGFLPKHLDPFGLPISKIEGLDYVISNVCAALETDNVMLKKRGALGVFSQDAKPDNVSGYVPMTKKERELLQEEMNEYGSQERQRKFFITRQAVKWVPISIKVSEMQTKETLTQCTGFIADRFGYPPELMSGKNATYENRKSAEQYLYQNNVIPNSLRDMMVYTVELISEYEDIFIVTNFDYLPVLQEDIAKQGEGIRFKSEGLSTQYQDGIITLNEYRTQLGYDTITEGDTYYEPPITQESGTAKSKSGVQSTK